MTSAVDRVARSVVFVAGLIAGLVSLGVGPAAGQEGAEPDEPETGWSVETDWGGNARLFVFEITDDLPGRNDIEQGALAPDHSSRSSQRSQATRL